MRLLRGVEAVPRLEPQAIPIQESNVGELGATEYGRKLRQLIQRRVGVSIQAGEIRARSGGEGMCRELFSLYRVHRANRSTPVSERRMWYVLTQMCEGCGELGTTQVP